MKNKKISFTSIMQYVCMFLILLYPFNATIDTLIYPSNMICITSVVVGMMGLFFFKRKYVFKKRNIIILIVTVLILMATLINNFYWVEGRETRVLLFSLYLFLPFIISSNGELENVLKNTLKFFSYEHIIGTYIGIFFKEFYKNIILTKMCAGKTICVAIGNNYHGYMTGFTTNFSTNAIYLSIATLLLFSELIQNKNKKNLLLFLLSILALFTSGKRAHLIFTIFCCIALYIIKKSKNIIKKYAKLIVIGILSIILFIVASSYIPEITNIINRFELLIETGDVMNGRNELYELAFKLWDKNLLIGNGWGSFSYYYQYNLYTPGTLSYLDAHNVFIQLLAEVGIIGFVIFSAIMLGSLIKSMEIAKKENNNIIVNFNFLYQLFFLLYCFTGNPLYDPMCYVIYFITIGYTIIKISNEEEAK